MANTTWQVALNADDRTLLAARQLLTTQTRSRATLLVGSAPTDLSIPCTVLNARLPPDLPEVPVVEWATAAVRLARSPADLPSTPSNSWCIAVDDTGSQWAGSEPTGRLVALVFGQGATVPNVPANLHATRNPDTALRCVDHILASPIGVLALRARDVPDVRSHERWRTALVALLERVLLLLPRGPDPSAELHVTVAVEQHSDIAAGDSMEAAVETIQLALLRAAVPLRPNLRLDVHIVGKGRYRPLVLADCLAWAWGSSLPAAAEAVRPWAEAGLLPTEDEDDPLPLRIPATYAHAPFDADHWRALCARAEAQPPSPLALHLRDLYERRAVETPGWCPAAVAATQLLLESRRFDSAMLRRDAESLRRMGLRPNYDTELRLGLLIAELAEHSRHGRLLKPARAARILATAQTLLDEHPGPASEVCLRLGVCHINALDWEAATRACPPDSAPLALLARGRVRSQQGQIAANRGDPAQAEQCFQSALDLFSRLSSPLAQAQESTQTASYRLANRWSLPPAGPAADRVALGHRLPPNDDALRDLFATRAPGRGWAQLDLLRWMAARPADTTAPLRLLLQSEPGWEPGDGHPWPLILLYRAILTQPHRPVAEVEHRLHQAVDAASTPTTGPALRLIAAAAEAHRLALRGDTHSHTLDRLHQELAATLPAATPHLAAARDRLAARQPWVGAEWLPALLPFSFR